VSQEDTPLHPLLQQMRTQPVAPPAKEGYLQCDSGDRLFYRAWVPDSPRKIILAIHGLGAHSEYYVIMADQVIETGIAVYAPDLKHHGRSTGRWGDIESFEELVVQIHQFISLLHTYHPGLPIFLAGISMGGCLAFNYALHHPTECKGIIAFAPAIAGGAPITISQVLLCPYYVLAHLVAPGKPVISIINQSKRGSSNPLRREYDARDPFRQQKVSFRTLLQLRKAMQFTSAHLEELKLPLIIIQGTKDWLVKPALVKKFFARLGSQDKTLIEVEGAYHALITEPLMDEKGVWVQLRNWIMAH